MYGARGVAVSQLRVCFCLCAGKSTVLCNRFGNPASRRDDERDSFVAAGAGRCVREAEVHDLLAKVFESLEEPLEGRCLLQRVSPSRRNRPKPQFYNNTLNHPEFPPPLIGGASLEMHKTTPQCMDFRSQSQF